jgi:hypothetical protein
MPGTTPLSSSSDEGCGCGGSEVQVTQDEPLPPPPSGKQWLRSGENTYAVGWRCTAVRYGDSPGEIIERFVFRF